MGPHSEETLPRLPKNNGDKKKKTTCEVGRDEPVPSFPRSRRQAQNGREPIRLLSGWLFYTVKPLNPLAGRLVDGPIWRWLDSRSVEKLIDDVSRALAQVLELLTRILSLYFFFRCCYSQRESKRSRELPRRHLTLFFLSSTPSSANKDMAIIKRRRFCFVWRGSLGLKLGWTVIKHASKREKTPLLQVAKWSDHFLRLRFWPLTRACVREVGR